jgi:hypothetical protein
MMPAAFESKLAGSIERMGHALSDWLDRRWTLFLLCSTGSTLLAFSGYAHTKTPWMDEVVFLTMVRQRGLAAVWGALMAGVQTDPPITHLVMHLLFRAVGESVFLARLPAILGFALMCFSLACLVRRHAGPVYGAAAYFLPYTATLMRSRAMDARPYAMMMGFSALALLCWDALEEGDARRRRAWRIGFALSLAATFCTHFYSILLLLPLAMGELTVWMEKRRPRWITPLGAAAALIPYAASLPILLAGRRIFGQYHGAPRFENLRQFFSNGLDSLPLAGVLILAAAALALKKDGPLWPAPAAPDWRQRALFASCAGFLILPAAGYAGGVAITKFFITYYFMISFFGIILGLPLLLASVSGRSRTIGLCLLLPIAGNAAMVTARGLSGFFRHDAPYPTMAQLAKLIPEPNPEIVVGSPTGYLPLYDANRFDPAAREMVFLFDRSKALASIGTDTSDVLYMQLRRYTAARIEAFDPYVGAHRGFYMLVMPGEDVDNWQFAYLEKRLKARIRWMGEPGGFVLYRIDLDPAGL